MEDAGQSSRLAVLNAEWHHVLNLEMNRPFERWYGTRERASASPLASFGTALGPYWIDKDVTPIKAALENYRLETISWWMIVREKWQEATHALS